MDKISHWTRILIAFAIFLFIYISVFGAKEGYETMYSYWVKSKKGKINGPRFTTGKACKATVYANKQGTVLGCQKGKKPNPNFTGKGYIVK
jgi:hypothetical protein